MIVESTDTTHSINPASALIACSPVRIAAHLPVCGYTADYATARVADAHHRRHSCTKHRRGLEQARRRAERFSSRVTRECSHPQTRHRHGTRAAYVKDRCRSTDCAAANTAASRTAGIGVERIAQLAGLSVSHVRQLADHGRGDSPGTQRVRPSTAKRGLAIGNGIGIGIASRAPHSLVDATGTRRRLQALIAIGWPAELLAAQLGRRTNCIQRGMTGEWVAAAPPTRSRLSTSGSRTPARRG